MSTRRRQLFTVLALLLLIGAATYWAGKHFRRERQHRLALAALERRDFVAAEGYLKQALDTAPADLTLRLEAARTARRRGDVGAANRHLRIFGKNHGPEGIIALEQALAEVQQGNRGDVERLLAFAEKYADVPETPLILEACIVGGLRGLTPATPGGQAAEHRDPRQVAEVERALDLFRRGSTNRADQVQEALWRGRLHAAKNDQTKALASVRQALELDPGSFEARLYFALFRLERSPAEAVAHLQALHAQEPDNNQVRFTLALALHNLGELAGAARLLDEMLSAQPDNAFALLERGSIAMDQQAPEDAERYFRRAFAAAPDDAKINFALATALQAAGKGEEAERCRARFRELEAARQKRP